MVLYDVPPWTIGVDSRSTDQWLAEAPGSVFATSHGNLIAIDSATGNLRWKSTLQAQGAPAVRRTVRCSRDAWRARVSRFGSGSTRRVLSGVNTTSLAGSPSTVVAFDNQTSRLCGLSAARQRRGAEISAYTTEMGRSSDWAVISSPFLQMPAGRYFDAANGRAVAAAADADTLVGSDGRYVWFTVREGGVKGLDLDTNRTFVMHNQIERGQVHCRTRSRGGRSRWAPALIDLQTQQSSQLHIDGRWIGGPVDGKIFIERGDGLYLQSIDPACEEHFALQRTRAKRAMSRATDRSDTWAPRRHHARHRSGAGPALAPFATGCNFYEGVTASGKTTVVHCDAGTQSQLVGFARER